MVICNFNGLIFSSSISEWKHVSCLPRKIQTIPFFLSPGFLDMKLKTVLYFYILEVSKFEVKERGKK